MEVISMDIEIKECIISDKYDVHGPKLNSYPTSAMLSVLRHLLILVYYLVISNSYL